MYNEYSRYAVCACISHGVCVLCMCTWYDMILHYTSMKYCDMIDQLKGVYFTYTPVNFTYTPVKFHLYTCKFPVVIGLVL